MMTPEEKEFIASNERLVQQILSQIKELDKFKVGDYLIAFDKITNKPIVNSYNAPQKFKVIFEDKNGMKYVKKLGANNRPVGQLICTLRFNNYTGWSNSNPVYDFAIDPDYTDAIILQEDSTFDATTDHRIKRDTFKQITQHNRNAKLHLETDNQIWSYIASLKVGDIIWKSHKSFWVVQSVIPISPQIKALSSATFFRAPKLITIKTNSNKILEKSFWDFNGGAFYHTQPRSYKQEIYNPNI